MVCVGVLLATQPQNILGMLHTGSRDIGFGGYDWVRELGIEDEVVEVLDTGLDPVRIVAAAPHLHVLEEGVGLHGRQLIVASEYENITKKWLASKGASASFMRAYGATESLPPDDADLIVDNTATGATLKANGLEIIETLLTSTTRLYASKKVRAGGGGGPIRRCILMTIILHTWRCALGCARGCTRAVVVLAVSDWDTGTVQPGQRTLPCYLRRATPAAALRPCWDPALFPMSY